MKKLTSIVLAVLILCLSACNNSQSISAKTVDDLISAIGTVTLESGEKISSAEEAIALLNENELKKVTLKDDLVAARETYNTLLTEKVAEVVKLINSIASVTLDSGIIVNKALTLYNALPDFAKEKVSNINVLNDAKAQYEELKKGAKADALSKLVKKYDEVQQTTFYKPKEYPDYIDTRCYVLPYISVIGSYKGLVITYNYTEDDWVFFKKVTFAIDDERYVKTFEYFDILHDSSYGIVCENISVQANSEDISILQKIVNSEKTIVRFQGDDYAYDFTISQSDKDAIRQVLTAYGV